jgi:hypothetical protein
MDATIDNKTNDAPTTAATDMTVADFAGGARRDRDG